MDKKICKMVVENRKRLVPILFTAQQVYLLQKYLKGRSLDRTEQAYLYSTIKKKTDALLAFKEEWYVTGSGLLPERIEEAKKILKGLGKEKAFISGSFLYAEKYGDIDIFMVSKKRSQRQKGKKQHISITENDLHKPLFISMIGCSVANFNVADYTAKEERLDFKELILQYELAINEILDNDDQKMLRRIIFEHNLYIKNTILDSKSLYEKFEELKSKKKEEKIGQINSMTKELFLNLFSAKYVYNELSSFVKTLEEDKESMKVYDNFEIYCNLFNGVRHECRRAEA